MRLSRMTAPVHLAEVTKDPGGDLAVMLTGGGARAAYQVGLLKGIARHFPHLKIQIPPEFETAWPTRAACLSHAGAEDPDAPGPIQPIQFSHKHHAGLY